MKIVIQRVLQSSVTIDGEVISAIGPGLMILLGVEVEDTKEQADKLIKKCLNLRIFDDENGVMNRSVLDVSGEMLIVSQFTLCASIRKGNRPSYIKAAGHDVAIPLYEYFCDQCCAVIGEERVKRGRFGADMKVELINDGPVTIMADSNDL